MPNKENTLHNKHQMLLGVLVSLHEEKEEKTERNGKRDGEGEMLRYGWGLGVREAGKTRPDSLSL